MTERPSHGEPAWFVRDSKLFVSYADHYHDDRVGFWCAAPPGAQQELVAESPGSFFVPPYVGVRGWLGVWLDVPADWTVIAELVQDAYRTVAARALVAQLDAAGRDAPRVRARADHRARPGSPVPWPLPAIVGMHYLQRPDARAEHLSGHEQVRRGFRDRHELDQRAVLQPHLLAGGRSARMQHVRGHAVEQGRCPPSPTTHASSSATCTRL